MNARKFFRSAFLVERNRWMILPIMALFNVLLAWLHSIFPLFYFVNHDPFRYLAIFSPTFYLMWHFRNQDKVSEIERANFVEFLNLAISVEDTKVYMGLRFLKDEMYDKNILRVHCFNAFRSLWNTNYLAEFAYFHHNGELTSHRKEPSFGILINWLKEEAKQHGSADEFEKFCSQEHIAVRFDEVGGGVSGQFDVENVAEAIWVERHNRFLL